MKKKSGPVKIGIKYPIDMSIIDKVDRSVKRLTRTMRKTLKQAVQSEPLITDYVSIRVTVKINTKGLANKFVKDAFKPTKEIK